VPWVDLVGGMGGDVRRNRRPLEALLAVANPPIAVSEPSTGSRPAFRRPKPGRRQWLCYE
jgi:hypothetical protein